jgi:starch phosphorylase
MRESMACLTPRFSTNRAVREYTEQYYLPAATAYRARAINNGEIGADMVNWLHELDQKWAALRFCEVMLEIEGEQQVFEVQVYLDDLDPEAVRVELYANGVIGTAAERVEMKRMRQLVGATNGYVLPRSRAYIPPGGGLYGATHTAPRRRDGSSGSRPYPLATVNRLRKVNE